MLLDYLIQFGLPEKEARLYLTLLKLGPSTAGLLAKKAKVPRTNAYHLLETLEQKQLVHAHEKSGKRLYTAAPPEQLSKQLKQRAERLTQLHQESERLMSAFAALMPQSKPATGLEVFIGLEAITQLYEKSLNARSEIILYTAQKSVREKALPHYFHSYEKRLEKRGLELRRVPLNTPNDILLYDDYAAFILFDEMKGILIHSQSVTETLKALW